MMASDSRAVRICSDLCCALRKGKNIHEFGFVYCPEPVYNKSPIVFVDGNLGIETWGIKPLYHYAYLQLFESEYKQHDLRKQSDFSMVVVLLNPECSSAWNLRKQLVLRKFLKVEDDLNLARLVLAKHPKSPETFCHRRWLLQQLYPSSSPALRVDSPQDVLRDGHRDDLAGRLQDVEGAACNDGSETLMTSVRAEIEVCAAAASRYPSNYNAWSHRIWVVEHLAGSPPQFLEMELKTTKPWVSSHISDHSGFHYRQFLLGTLTGLSSGGSSKRVCKGWNVSLYVQLLLQELQLILDLVTSYPGHEAVWYHRRFVVHLWKALLCNGTLTEPDKITEIREAANSSKLSQMPILPIGSGSTRDHPTKNQTKRPSENKSFENGEDIGEACFSGGSASQRKHVCLTADLESTSLVCGASSRGDSEPLIHPGESACQPRSRPTPDSSSEQLPDQRGMSHQRTVSSKTAARASSRKGSCRTDDAFSSHEILRLIQHEKRFVEIVVDGTHLGEKEAQQRCALNYSHWLDNLAAS